MILVKFPKHSITSLKGKLWKAGHFPNRFIYISLIAYFIQDIERVVSLSITHIANLNTQTVAFGDL